MNKRIYFNAFHMNCVVHQSPGLWVRDDDKMDRYTDLDTWVELARLLERGKFDALFLADVVGVYDVYRDNREAALTQAAQVPVNDPMVLIPAMAYATEHLGFAFTSSVLQSHPFAFARTISTLDHLTKGRIAWNIVTSYLESAGRSFGQPGLPEHDERYDIGDEYLAVCYKLWEASWQDDAVVKDRQRGIYADRARSTTCATTANTFGSTAATWPSRPPSAHRCCTRLAPRRAAGALRPNMPRACSSAQSPGCWRLYSGHARRSGQTRPAARGHRFLDLSQGHHRGTEAEARRKYEDFFEQVSYEGALALLSGWSGIDFGRYDPDQELEYVETNAVRTLMQMFAKTDTTRRRWTMRDLAKYVGIGGGGPVLVGAPEQIADALQDWIEVGVDGFNLAYAITPGTFEDFVDGVAPVLQQRGMMQRAYQDGTFREKLFGQGRARLAAPHPAALARRATDEGRVDTPQEPRVTDTDQASAPGHPARL